jgi:7,8-dihydropterin-6-yl-methyl-4-(beta-D-ribofuranosyl)aminobenzene 5'-phosphate synthase
MVNFLSVNILCDNTAAGNFLGEHGLSFFIQVDDKNILFDTGKGEVLEHNMLEAGLKPSMLDFLLFSHGHYDHTGGISYIFKDEDLCAKARKKMISIYMHKEALNEKFSKTLNGPKYIGTSDENIMILQQYNDITFYNQSNIEILPGVTLTGEIPRLNPIENRKTKFFLNKELSEVDNIKDDQALYIKTSKGIVVVLGCCHSGLANTLDYITELEQVDTIYAVIGGTHLRNADNKQLDFTIDILKKYRVKLFAPIHCSGQRASAYMFYKTQDIFREANAGCVFNF